MNDPIRTTRLDIVDPKNPEKVVATLAGADGGAGLWITGPEGILISIYAIHGQAAIGFYDKQGQRDSKGLNFALTMAGEPTIQFRDHDGAAQFVKLADIADAISEKV